MDLNEKREQNKRLIAEIVRFLLVGGLATVCDYLVYVLFREVLLPVELIADSAVWDAFSAVIAKALGFLTGLLINWILSVIFVFRDTKKKVGVSSKRDFFVFTVIALIGLAFTLLTVGFGVLLVPNFSLFGTETLFGVGWNEWLLQGVTTCIVLVFNYFARKKFIFNKN